MYLLNINMFFEADGIIHPNGVWGTITDGIFPLLAVLTSEYHTYSNNNGFLVKITVFFTDTTGIKL